VSGKFAFAWVRAKGHDGLRPVILGEVRECEEFEVVEAHEFDADKLWLALVAVRDGERLVDELARRWPSPERAPDDPRLPDHARDVLGGPRPAPHPMPGEPGWPIEEHKP
jgi:hypothetical protein